jgi:DNA polymerase-3 subunit epsilon
VTTLNEEDEAAEALEETGNYRVLRRIQGWRDLTPPPDARLKMGLMVDVETTGLDPEADTIIELGLIPFNYDAAGRIYVVGEPFQAFNDPGRPIPAEITALTGITDDMVKGHRLDVAEIDELFGLANFAVAHHAAFDRRFIEKVAPEAIKKPWGCSMSQVPWNEEGINGRSLEYIAMKQGFFFDGHRAADDCLAAIHMLAQPLPRSGKLAMAALRETAAKKTLRLWAENSPFETKDTLKKRGYKWSDGSIAGKPKAWFFDTIDQAAADREAEWLKAEIYCRPVPLRVDAFTFYERFSNRE